MLARLGHRAVRGVDDEDAAVHLRRARDHVLDVIRVAGAVDVRVVALLRLVLDVRGADGDSARALLGRLVDLIERDRLGAAGLESTFVIAAVSVVLPWSTWPIVPMFTCSFVRELTS